MKVTDAKKLTPEQQAEIVQLAASLWGSVGGAMTKVKYGSEYYKAIGEKGRATQKKIRDAAKKKGQLVLAKPRPHI